MIIISVESLKSGMKIAKSLFDVNGKVLLGHGVILNNFYIQRLKELGINSLFIEEEKTKDVIPLENISDKVRRSTARYMKSIFKSVESIKNEISSQTSMAVLDTLTSERFESTFARNPAFGKLIGAAKNIVDEILNGELMLYMSSIKTASNYTFQHSIDVAIVAIMLGRKIGLSHKRLQELGIGCLLHDIGYIFVPEEIINKGDKLTPEEFVHIKNHPQAGYDLIKNNPSIGILPPHVVLQHHEKQDGTGYPQGLYGDNNIKITDEPRKIHLYGSIAAVADIYDSLSSERSFRRALPPEKVIKIMLGMSGNHLNSEVFHNFLLIAPIYPVGSTIRIIKGEHIYHIGVVTSLNRGNLDRPQIRLIYGPKRKPINPININLLERDDIKIKSIIL